MHQRDVIEDALADRYRRFVLYHLIEHQSQSLAEVTDYILEIEALGRDGSPDRRHVRTALAERHLPRLEAADLVEYDADGSDVRLAISPAKARQIHRSAVRRAQP